LSATARSTCYSRISRRICAGGQSSWSRQGRGSPSTPRPAFGAAIRVAFDVPADAKRLTRLETGVLMATAYFQPVTRGELSETFGLEISRDLIAGARTGGSPPDRAARRPAPYAYVTTEKFLIGFGFESLRDLPDLEALKDAGLLSADVRSTKEAGEMARRTQARERQRWKRPEFASRSGSDSGWKLAVLVPWLVVEADTRSPLPR
jgi:hypothetical protein